MNVVIQDSRLSEQPRLSDDARLLRQAKNGDAEAFGVLYERYAPPIHRFLFAHLSDRMDAEDLTEEVFIKVWQRLPGYREQGVPFIAFLMRVAHNVLIDHYRSFGRTAIETLTEDSVFADPLADPGTLTQVNLEHQELKRLLGQLREDYRFVLVSRFMSGLTPEETAQAMNKSEGAIRVLQHRALEALRKLLEARSD